MNKVTNMIPSVDINVVQKLFDYFSRAYGQSWTSRHKTAEEWDHCVNLWLEELQKYGVVTLRNATRSALLLHKTFPPTLGEMIQLCLEASGVPSLEVCFQNAILRNFIHPLVLMSFNKVGSHYFSNMNDVPLRSRFKTAYDEALSEFCINPTKANLELENYHKAAKQLTSCTKKDAETVNREKRRFNYAQLMTAKKKEKLVIDDNFTNEARNNYLINLSDKDSLELHWHDAGDRLFLLKEKAALPYPDKPLSETYERKERSAKNVLKYCKPFVTRRTTE